jgi:hypothetical protein
VSGQDGLDLAAVLAEHEGHGPNCLVRPAWDLQSEPCLPYRLAALALNLQGKVARVEAAAQVAVMPNREKEPGGWRRGEDSALRRVLAALADPTPTATCPKVTPFKAYTEETCSRPEGHAGGCLFTSHDGRTPLEVMPK